MIKNKKRKHKKSKFILFLIVLPLLFLLAILSKPKDNKIAVHDEDHIFNGGVIMHDLLCHLRIDEKYKDDVELRKRINQKIDKEFISICGDKDYYSLRIDVPCNFDFYYHYIEVKILLNRLDNSAKSAIAPILKSSYEKYKMLYVKDYLAVRDNRWTITLNSMKKLDILNESERKFWIRQYANFEINESQPIFTQTWNKIYALRTGLGIKNFSILSNYNISNTAICSYIPTIQDAFTQNVFKETKRVMIIKYKSIREFCAHNLNKTESKELEMHLSNITGCHE